MNLLSFFLAASLSASAVPPVPSWHPSSEPFLLGLCSVNVGTFFEPEFTPVPGGDCNGCGIAVGQIPGNPDYTVTVTQDEVNPGKCGPLDGDPCTTVNQCYSKHTVSVSGPRDPDENYRGWVYDTSVSPPLLLFTYPITSFPHTVLLAADCGKGTKLVIKTVLGGAIHTISNTCAACYED